MDGHQVVFGFSGGVVTAGQVYGAAGHQQFFAAAGIFYVDGFFLAVYFHLGNKAVGTGQKAAGTDIGIVHRVLLYWGWTLTASLVFIIPRRREEIRGKAWGKCPRGMAECTKVFIFNVYKLAGYGTIFLYFGQKRMEKEMRNFRKATITKKGERAARHGHPWVFADEVLALDGAYENGQLVDVVNEKGKYIGTGFINDHSKIRIRLLSQNANDTFNEAFFERRIQYALDYRKTVMLGADFRCCRLIFGEADGFPGLTVDRFEDVLVAQVLSLGIEQRKQLIFSLLLKMRAMGEDVKGVYERNDVKIRELEGMEEGCGIAEVPGSTLTEDDLLPIITENGLKYQVDVVNGQKTGYFLDQKYNRLAVQRICKGKHLLDCFTHTGPFA